MFPLNADIQIDRKHTASYEQVLEHLFPLLTAERQSRIQQVVKERSFSCSVVLENIYDRGNISACLRSAEAMGLASVHLIESEKFKESQRTTAGADKWLEVQRWKSTAELIKQVKQEGKQLVVTHLSATAVDISKVDFSKPTALVLGNEKDGVSEEMVAAADYRVILPIQGFVQSYNISVAAALCFYHVYRDRMARVGHHGDLSEVQQQILKAHYTLRTLDSGVDILKNKLGEG